MHARTTCTRRCRVPRACLCRVSARRGVCWLLAFSAETPRRVPSPSRASTIRAARQTCPPPRQTHNLGKHRLCNPPRRAAQAKDSCCPAEWRRQERGRCDTVRYGAVRAVRCGTGRRWLVAARSLAVGRWPPPGASVDRLVSDKHITTLVSSPPLSPPLPYLELVLTTHAPHLTARLRGISSRSRRRRDGSTARQHRRLPHRRLTAGCTAAAHTALASFARHGAMALLFVLLLAFIAALASARPTQRTANPVNVRLGARSGGQYHPDPVTRRHWTRERARLGDEHKLHRRSGLNGSAR